MMKHLNDLEKEIELVFGGLPRPPTLLNMNEYNRVRFASEVRALEEMDWDNGVPSDLEKFYEPNTFLSVDGYKYLIPKVFSFCRKWGDEICNTDFVPTMISLPFLTVQDEFLKMFSRVEKILLWHFLEECSKLIGNSVFEDFYDAHILKKKLMGVSM